jgi:hypothetical protein
MGTVMYPVIKSLSKYKMGKYVDYDLIAEDDNHDYNDEYRDRMYQACRRINAKVFEETGIKSFLKYDTKQVRVNVM